MQLDMCWWCILRMKRYCDPKYKNKVTASKDVLQLYATEEGRNLFGIYLWHCCLPMFFYIHHMFAPVTEVRSYEPLWRNMGTSRMLSLRSRAGTGSPTNLAKREDGSQSLTWWKWKSIAGLLTVCYAIICYQDCFNICNGLLYNVFYLQDHGWPFLCLGKGTWSCPWQHGSWWRGSKASARGFVCQWNEKGEMTNQHASGLVEDPVAKVLHFQKSYESSSPHSHL